MQRQAGGAVGVDAVERLGPQERLGESLELRPVGGKQVGHNQTFGSDASKNFVPRRTSG